MVTIVLRTQSESAGSTRVLALDALRGFALIWLVGFRELIDSFVCLGNNESRPWRPFFWVPIQLKHISWEGFRFLDLLFPLLLFLAGISVVVAVPKWKEKSGVAGVYARVLWRTLALVTLGIIYTGGVRGGWEEVRWLGILQRIALTTGLTALLFCHLRVRGLVAATALILLGYWWAMARVSVPNLTLDANTVHDAMAELGATNVVDALAKTPERIRGSYMPGLNFAHYIDALYLPGHRYRSYWDPEGILSTLPAVASCLLGCLSGLFLQRTDLSASRKSTLLATGGVVLVAVGWTWGLVFPVVKLIWSSSFVLVAAGYSCWLLAVFLWAIDVKGWGAKMAPLVWVGSNALLLYMSAKLVGFDKLAERLLGSPEQHWIDAHWLSGSGSFLSAALAFALMQGLARFLYANKILIRL